jgi:hypothetical protein
MISRLVEVSLVVTQCKIPTLRLNIKLSIREVQLIHAKGDIARNTMVARHSSVIVPLIYVNLLFLEVLEHPQHNTDLPL